MRLSHLYRPTAQIVSKDLGVQNQHALRVEEAANEVKLARVPQHDAVVDARDDPWTLCQAKEDRRRVQVGDARRGARAPLSQLGQWREGVFECTPLHARPRVLAPEEALRALTDDECRPFHQKGTKRGSVLSRERVAVRDRVAIVWRWRRRRRA